MPRKNPAASAPKPKAKPKPKKKAGAAPKKPAPNPTGAEHVPDPAKRETVKMAAGMGIPHKLIARLIGLGSDHTLRKHYAEDLELGEALAVFKVAKTLFSQATNEKNPNLSAAIFFLKCKGGYREKVPLDDPAKKGSLAELIVMSGLNDAGARGMPDEGGQP